jgi:hypothetical protein
LVDEGLATNIGLRYATLESSPAVRTGRKTREMLICYTPAVTARVP